MYLKSGQKITQWLDFLGALITDYQDTFNGIFEMLTFQSEVTFDSMGNFAGSKIEGYRLGLEIVSKWFNINRDFKCTLINPDTNKPYSAVLQLSDREMFRLLKTQLWKIGFDGTTESLEFNLKYAFTTSDTTEDLSIFIYNHENEPATARILLLYKPGTFTSNDQRLWLAGYYNNPILGINYIYNAVPNNQLVYDLNVKYDGRWDEGVVLPVAEFTIGVQFGDRYFNETTNKLHTYTGIEWDDGIVIPTTAPTDVGINTPGGTMWFDEAFNTLYTWIFIPVYDGDLEDTDSEGE